MKHRQKKEIRKIHQEMLEGYTRRMQRVRNSKVYSKQIVKSIEYISEHLHNRIMLSDMAEYLQISEAYLSRLFKEETGISFSDYVNQQKVEAAANLLRYSDYTDSEISSLFSFSSQSYFIKVFRKHTGMTPKAYKKQYMMPELEQAVSS